MAHVSEATRERLLKDTCANQAACNHLLYEYEKKARERKVIRDRTVDHQQAQRIPGS
jgi:hypothetical protein